MNAWMGPIKNTSNIFQTTSKTNVRTSPIGMAPSFHAPSAAMRLSISAPENRLPKSRSARVMGLAISSTRFMNRLTGNRNFGNGCRR